METFLNWQIWHFCHSCTKLTSRGFKISKKKIASIGYWTHNTNPAIEIPATLPIQPQRHLLNRRFMNWTWIISGSIEHDFIRVWKFETGMDWQIGWLGKVAGNLIVGLVLWVQYPLEAIIFCWFWNPVMSILYKNDRNVRSVNLRKTRMETFVSVDEKPTDQVVSIKTALLPEDYSTHWLSSSKITPIAICGSRILRIREPLVVEQAISFRGTFLPENLEHFQKNCL